ncbi:MAG TPA: hypothetical protein VMB72_00320 [Acidimicrobiales bacterium]|nr:hypothetical protein [Acidimicrobiales bacterium]
MTLIGPHPTPAPAPASIGPPGPGPAAGAPVVGTRPQPVAWSAMSKRTVKRKIRSKKKANHGKRPNAGRG